MATVVLVIHVMLAIAMVATVLLQRSEGGALGMGGGGMGGLMTGRATANLLSRTTAILAACFMVTSLFLAWLAGYERKPASIIPELPTATAPAVPGPAGAPQPPAAAPSGQAVPQAAPSGEPAKPSQPPEGAKPSQPEVPLAK